jgi:hypothetical protein
MTLCTSEDKPCRAWTMDQDIASFVNAYGGANESWTAKLGEAKQLRISCHYGSKTNLGRVEVTWGAILGHRVSRSLG